MSAKSNAVLKCLPVFLAAFLLAPVLDAQTYSQTNTVSSNSGLTSALAGAVPGEMIQLANGNYAGFSVSKSGTVANPIAIQAANQGQAVITSGIISLNSVAYVTVQGLNVTTTGGGFSADSTSVDVEMGLNGATNCRVTRCVFDPPTNTLPANTFFTYLSGTCLSNRVDHCEYGWYTNSGCHAVRTSGNVTIANVTPPSDRTPWAFGYGPYNPNMARFTRIDHNYFHDHYTPGANGGETIQLGAIGDTGDYQNLYSLVEYNLFVNCDGDPEIISVKSSSNTIRYNTVRTSAAVFSLRAGNGDIVYGNFFLCAGAGGGIKASEHDHKIYDNYIENTDDSNYPIMFESGNLYNYAFSHAQCVRVQVTHNTVVNPGRQVLFEHSGALPAVDFTFANNIITGFGTLYSEDVTSLNPFRSQNIIYGYTPGQSGFLVENPQLTAADPEKLSSSSPAINAGNTNYYSYVTEDMDGQPRSLPRDIGADEYDTADFIARAPLTTNDIGPNSVDIELSALPAAQAVNLGATNISYTLNVTADSGFTNPVTFTVTGMTPGMTAGINPVSVNGSGTVQLNVTNTAAVLGGNYPLAVNATGSNFTSTINVTLQAGRSPSNLRWAGTSSALWNLQGSSNWFNFGGSAADAFYNGDTVLLDDTAGVPTSLTIPTSATVSPSIVTNNSSANNFTITGGGQITGATAMMKLGASILTLNTTNLFSGGITIAGGTLKAGNPYALGGQGGFVIVTNNATLDVNGNNLGMDTVLASGMGVSNNGAIINSGATASPALALAELAGDTTFGGTGRWDLRASGGTTGSPLTASLSTSGNAYNLTKVGANFIGIVSVTVDPGLGNINLTAGTLDIEGYTTGLGNPAATLTVYSNAILYLYSDFFATNAALNKVIALDDGAILQNASGTNCLAGSMTLAGNDTFNIGGTWLIVSNNLSGSGNLIKLGTAPLYLSGTDTGSGTIIASNGMLVAAGSLAGGPVAIASGATVSVTGTVTAGGGGITGPAGSVLALTNGTLQFSVSAGSTNASIGVLSFGGTGNTINITSLPLVTGLPAQFPLIKYVSEIGAFNLALGTVAGGYGGFISNNLANGSVDLVVTSSQPLLEWNGANGVEWNLAAANWSNSVSGASPAVFQNANTAIFDDSVTNAAAVRTNIDIAAGVVVQPGFAVFNDSAVSYTISGAGEISGAAQIFKSGTGSLTLGCTNNFTGGVLVSGGTLLAGTASALGSASGSTFVTNGGTLDVNGFNLTAEPVTASGWGVNSNGAIVDSGAQQTTALRQLTFAGNAALGGINRWDIRDSGGTASLGTSPAGSPFKITKVGPNQVSLVGVGVIEPMLGDIDVQQGEFAIQTSTVQLGNPTNTITVYSNAILEVWALTSGPLNKKIVMQDGSIFFNENGTSTNAGPVTLQGNDTFNIEGTALKFTSQLGGSGSLIKTEGGAMYLGASNTFTGTTSVNGGTLFLTGAGSLAGSATISIAAGAVLDVSAETTLPLAAGQTLNGVGTVNGSLLVNPGAVVSPGGSSTGLLTVTNAVTLRGVTQMTLNQAGVTNDVLQAGGSLSYGGTLTLTNLGGTLAVGDSFKLFNAANYTGAFTNLTPAIPGLNLAWNTNSLIMSGVLGIIASPTPPPNFTAMTWVGTNLVLRGTNGVPGWPYLVLSSTNLASPFSGWTHSPTNYFDGAGDFSFTNNPAPGVAAQFYLLMLP